MSNLGKKIFTTQKRLVTEIVKEMTGPFTAQDVCARTRKRRPRVSRATVYRMLTELSQEHVIREFWLPSNRRMCIRSDNALVCITECADCGKIECLDGKELQLGIQLIPSADVQTTIHRKVRCPHRLVTGTCIGCKPKSSSGTNRATVKDASGKTS